MSEIREIALRQMAGLVLETRDYLKAWGYPLPFELKRRDPIEPGRERKEQAEDRLYAIVWRYFRKQRKIIHERLGAAFPDRKAIAQLPPIYTDDLFDDPEFHAALLRMLQTTVIDGVALFAESNLIGIDYTLINTMAADWAAKYVGELIDGIDNTTKEGLKKAVAAFVGTPGMTVGDVANILPFSESRALSVAVTEITRTYATAEEITGKQLAKEFPSIQVIKQWWTNNDDRVCPICAPLHGMVVSIQEGFTTEEDKSFGVPHPPAHVSCRCWTSSTTRITENA